MTNGSKVDVGKAAGLSSPLAKRFLLFLCRQSQQLSWRRKTLRPLSMLLLLLLASPLISLSSTSPPTVSLYSVGSSGTTTSKFSAFQPRPAKLSCLSMSSFHRNPLRVSMGIKKEFVVMKGKMRGLGAMCYTYDAPLCINTLQFISTISTTVLLLAKGTAVQKSFLVPLFLLQAPAAVISWIKGEYDACKHRWVDNLQRSGYGAHE
ncbi:hypothetical protein ACFX2G_024486 [Malus domestica]